MVSDSQGQHLISPRNRRTDEEITTDASRARITAIHFLSVQSEGVTILGKLSPRELGGRGGGTRRAVPWLAPDHPRPGRAGQRGPSFVPGTPRGSSGSRAPAAGGGERGGPRSPGCRRCTCPGPHPSPGERAALTACTCRCTRWRWSRCRRSSPPRRSS